MSNLVEFILKSYDDNSEIGIFGNKLLSAISNNEEVEISDEMSESIKYLRELDNKLDLLWIDFYSWNNLPLLIRKNLSEHIKIVEYQAVYFAYSDFIKIIPILNLTNNYSIYTLKTGRCYRIIILGGSLDSIYSKDSKYLKLIDNIIKDSVIDSFSTKVINE